MLHIHCSRPWPCAPQHRDPTAYGARAQVEDAKRVLLLQGNKVSQTVKEVLSDLAMVKRGEAFKMTRKNAVWPFEAGHEASLQFFCERADCGLFCLGNHNAKRPHNLVLGRVFNAQLLDMLELGVERHVAIGACKAGKHVLVGAKVHPLHASLPTRYLRCGPPCQPYVPFLCGHLRAQVTLACRAAVLCIHRGGVRERRALQARQEHAARLVPRAGGGGDEPHGHLTRLRLLCCGPEPH